MWPPRRAITGTCRTPRSSTKLDVNRKCRTHHQEGTTTDRVARGGHFYRKLEYEEAERWRNWLVRKYQAQGNHQRAREWSPEVTTIHPDGTFSRDRAAYRKVHDECATPIRPTSEAVLERG